MARNRLNLTDSLNSAVAKAMPKNPDPAPEANPAVEAVLEEPTPARRTSPPAPRKRAKAVKPPAAGSSGQTETARLGVYLTTQEFDDARAAYMADWNHGGTADTFAYWLAGAVDEHARLSVKQRNAHAQPRARADERSGITRSFNVPVTSVARMRAAITADREDAGQFPSDSAWCREAIRSAVDKARARNGGSLPTPPARLPNRLVR